jgi:hypothetical protein
MTTEEVELVGEIKMLGNNGTIGAPFPGVSWTTGQIPPVGTKLYAVSSQVSEPEFYSIQLEWDFNQRGLFFKTEQAAHEWVKQNVVPHLTESMIESMIDGPFTFESLATAGLYEVRALRRKLG